MERQGVSCCFSIWGACWFYVLVRVDNGSRRERHPVATQILGVLRLLGAFPAFNLVLHERVTVYLEDYYMFYISLLHPWGSALEIE